MKFIMCSSPVNVYLLIKLYYPANKPHILLGIRGVLTWLECFLKLKCIVTLSLST